jgi:hypothetical protein
MSMIGRERTEQPGEQRGHNQVTGTATVEPGMFTEPGQEQTRPAQPSANILGRSACETVSMIRTSVQSSWDRTSELIARHPLAACALGLGLGILVSRWYDSRTRSGVRGA